MLKVIIPVALLAVCLFIQNGNCAMTEAQIKAALKLIKNTCIPKAKTTEVILFEDLSHTYDPVSAQVIGMHQGNWNLDKSGMCYVYCALNYYKLIKPDNTFNWEDGIKMVQGQVPATMATDIVASMTACKDAAKTTSEKCTAAYEIAKCIYDFKPEKYFLP